MKDGKKDKITRRADVAGPKSVILRLLSLAATTTPQPSYVRGGVPWLLPQRSALKSVRKGPGCINPYICRWTSGESVHGNSTLWPQTSEFQLNPRLIQYFRARSSAGLYADSDAPFLHTVSPVVLLQPIKQTYASITFWLLNNDFQSDLKPVKLDYRETPLSRRYASSDFPGRRCSLFFIHRLLSCA